MNNQPFDPTTGETRDDTLLNGIETNTPSRASEQRMQREDDWEDYCFRANVILHGVEKAYAMREAANRWNET